MSHVHRPSLAGLTAASFGLGVPTPVSHGGPPAGGALAPPAPYDGWVGPPSDRLNATRQLLWMDARVTELTQQVQRLRGKYGLLQESGLDAAGLEPVLTDLRERETDLRALDADRRVVQKKLAAMERSDAESKTAEKSYHRLAAKRVSIISPGSGGVPGGSPTAAGALRAKRPSIMMGFGPTSGTGTPPMPMGGFDHALAALQAPDLNMASAIDQELFLERRQAKQRREEQFESQFGKLSVYAPVSRAVSRRNSTAGSSRRNSTAPPSRRPSTLAPRARVSPLASQPQWIMEESDEDETSSDGSASSDESTSSRVSTHRRGSSATSTTTGAHGRPTLLTGANMLREETEQEVDSAGGSPFDEEEEEARGGAKKQYPGGGVGVGGVLSIREEEEGPTGPRERPAFLTNAAEASAADLSNSLQNYIKLQTETPAGGLTATEALIDPHLREKISKALQAYIQAASQAAMESIERLDFHATPAAGCTSGGAGSDQSASLEDSHQLVLLQRRPVPSREEELLWGLLMGCLRNEEEEQLAIEWWADREKQLFAEQAARVRRLEESSNNGSGNATGGRGAAATHHQEQSFADPTAPSSSLAISRYSPDMVSRHLDDHLASTAMHALAGSSSAHAARGRLLNALARKQEELRQLKAGHLLASMALKATHEMHRLKQHALGGAQQGAQKNHQQHHHHHHHNASPSSRDARRRLYSPNGGGGVGGGASGGSQVASGSPLASVQFSPIEPMCRRFVLSVVSSALANAGILARQDKVLQDLRWAIQKAKRVRDLTKNGSINRPASARPAWVSNVSHPTQMPRPHGHGEDIFWHWVTTEADQEKARVITEQAGRSTTGGRGGAEPSAQRAAGVQEEESKENTHQHHSPRSLVSGTDRPGRGFADPLYTPPAFSAAALEDQRRRLGDHVHITPASTVLHALTANQHHQRKIIKLVRPPSQSIAFTPTAATATATSTAAAMIALPASLPHEVPEDPSTRQAVQTWQELRWRDEAVKADKTLARRGSTLTLDDPLNHMSQRYATPKSPNPYDPFAIVYPIDAPGLDTSTMPLEDPSLLGSPPALFVGPAVIDEWHHFVTNLDQTAERARARVKRTEEDGLSTRLALAREESDADALLHLSHGGRPMVRLGEKPSKDPTNKTRPPPPTPAEKFAAGAVHSAYAVATIPARHLPRGAYHGCTAHQPHPDHEPDVNSYMSARSRQLSKRAKMLARVDGGRTMEVVRATRNAFAAHFHPGTNTLDWLPIDPQHPARQCHANCRVQYEVDLGGATVNNPLGGAPQAQSSHAHGEDTEVVSPRGASQQRRPLSAQSTHPQQQRRIVVVKSSYPREDHATSGHGNSAGSGLSRPQTARPSKTYASATNHTGLSSKIFTNAPPSSVRRTVKAPPTPTPKTHTRTLSARPTTTHDGRATEAEDDPWGGWETDEHARESTTPPLAAAGAPMFQPHPPLAPAARPSSAAMHQPRQPAAPQRPGTARR